MRTNKSCLIIEGARQNNLKNISLRIPHDKVTVLTGVSGAGKSSLAMDTIFAESHTRYLESLSTYSRMFLERLNRPALDNIRNLRPAIALEQRNPVRTSRATVGTVTEIYDYLRLLFAKGGTIYCPKCKKLVKADSAESVSAKLLAAYPGKSILITFAAEKTGELLKKGFVRVKKGKRIYHLEEDKLPQHLTSFKVIVDRLALKKNQQARLTESLELAFREGNGTIWIEFGPGGTRRFSSRLQCPQCGKKFTQPQPHQFSFNHALGACSRCKGFGNLLLYDQDKVIPNQKLSLAQGAVEPWTKPSHSWWYESLSGINLHKPYNQLSKSSKQYINETLAEFFSLLERKRYKLHVRVFLSRYKSQFPCPACRGSRLRPEALQVKIKDKDIHQLTKMSISDDLIFFRSIKTTALNKDILETIIHKLTLLIKVGLDYLTLNRQIRSLSGGESQRVNLARQLGQGLVGTLYILDEPTIGLHPRDTNNLLTILHSLARQGNTLLIVEHDHQIINNADHLIQLGPGAGEYGGRITYSGSAKKNPLTLPEIPLPSARRYNPRSCLRLNGARLHNLKNINISFPLGTFICVTGVSGSGKSSLIYDTLYNALAREFRQPAKRPGPYKEIRGLKSLRGVRLIDQEPISRSLKSNPATYIGVFSDIRRLFAATTAAQLAGLTGSSFSFNTGNGRCPACEGNGLQKIEMYFLADLYSRCPECDGKRYRKETLKVTYQGKNIAEVLQLTIAQAQEFFADTKTIRNKLKLLIQVGLGYLRLGQPFSTLSGGEAQRLKIAAELSTKEIKDHLFILDEPTTGLALQDIKTLLSVLNRLVDQGNTVIVIEHNLDVIKTADYIIDLGPEGGAQGGRIVASGPPEEIIKNKKSLTGKFLRKYLA